MQLTRINETFRKIAETQIRHRWLILLLLAALTAFGFAGLPRTRMESSNSSWFEEDDAVEVAQRRFEECFGNSDTIGILIEAEDVFTYEVLSMMRELGEELLLNVPYADEVTSLTELEVSIGTDEGINVQTLVGDTIPSSPEDLKEIRRLALSRKSVVNKLVSADATETWLILSLREYPPEEEWLTTTGVDPMYEVGEAAIAIVTDPRWESSSYTLKAAGMPYTETEERDYIQKQMLETVSIGFLVMIVLLAAFIRSFRGVVVPVFTTAAGIMLVFGFMGWLSIGLQTIMLALPLLLGMALSVGYSVHLINSFKQFYRLGTPRREAVVMAVAKTGWPILFTVFTTMGSLFSFTVVGLLPVRWLGITCAAVVFAVYVYVIILIPILFSFGKPHPKALSEGKTAEPWHQRFFAGFSQRILSRPKLVIGVSIVVVAVALPGILKIRVNLDSFEMMGLKIPYVNRVYSMTKSDLGSFLNYNITVTFNEQDAVKDPEVLKNFEKLLERVGEFEQTKKNDKAAKVFSVLDILKDMNQTLHADDPSFYAIPESRDMVAQIMFLYELSGGTKSYEWVDEDYSMLRAMVEMKDFDANEAAAALEEIRAMAGELFPGAQVAVVGAAVRFADMNSRIVWAEIKSFFTSLSIIFILLALVFASVRTGLIGLIPNMAPVLVLGGLMGYAHFQLDMITMIVMPMLLGIAVDDTIHFVNQIKYEFEVCGSYRGAVKQAFLSVGHTLAMTTVLLVCSFGSYLLSPIQVWMRLGIMAPLGLLAALIADYTITPVLILLTRPFGEERKGDELS